MQRLAIGLTIVVSLWPLPVRAQDASLRRIDLALQQSVPVFDSLLTHELPSGPKKLGPFTLVPPTGRGEIVRVSLPVGELISQALNQVRTAAARRQEAAARREVEAALKAFLRREQGPEP